MLGCGWKDLGGGGGWVSCKVEVYHRVAAHTSWAI